VVTFFGGNDVFEPKFFIACAGQAKVLLAL
jgi:hypothetical protein